MDEITQADEWEALVDGEQVALVLEGTSLETLAVPQGLRACQAGQSRRRHKEEPWDWEPVWPRRRPGTRPPGPQ